jgi:hypothetical protein
MKAFLPDCLTSLSKLALVNSTAEPLTASADATRSSVRMSDVEVVTCALLLHCERVFLYPLQTHYIIFLMWVEFLPNPYLLVRVAIA